MKRAAETRVLCVLCTAFSEFSCAPLERRVWLHVFDFTALTPFFRGSIIVSRDNYPRNNFKFVVNFDLKESVLQTVDVATLKMEVTVVPAKYHPSSAPVPLALLHHCIRLEPERLQDVLSPRDHWRISQDLLEYALLCGQYQSLKVLLRTFGDLHPSERSLSVALASGLGDVALCLQTLFGGGSDRLDPEIYSDCIYKYFEPDHRADVLPVLLDLLGWSKGIPFRIGGHCLQLSVQHRNWAAVQPLVEIGANVNAESAGLYTPLAGAVWHGQVEVVELLLQRGADASRVCMEWSPLMYAATRGHTACARLLLEHGALIDGATPTGDTALHMACRDGHVELAKELIRRGANSSLRNWSHLTALEVLMDIDGEEVGELRAMMQ